METLIVEGVEVAEFLGRGTDLALSTQAERMVPIVEQAVRAYVGRLFGLGPTSVYLVGTRGRRLVLGDRQVIQVTAVSLDGEEVTDFRWTRRGELWRDQGWGGPDREVTVFYRTADALPDAVRGVILSATARLVTNPEQVDFLATDGGYQLRHGSPGLQFTPTERLILDRYRRRTWP